MMTNTLQKYPIIAYSERKSFTNIATSSHSSFNLCTLHVSVMKEDKKRYKLKDHVAEVVTPQVLMYTVDSLRLFYLGPNISCGRTNFANSSSVR